MDEIIVAMTTQMDELVQELEACKTNKSAAGRARKLTLSLAKLGKDFRKQSIEYHKK